MTLVSRGPGREGERRLPAAAHGRAALHAALRASAGPVPWETFWTVLPSVCPHSTPRHNIPEHSELLHPSEVVEEFYHCSKSYKKAGVSEYSAAAASRTATSGPAPGAPRMFARAALPGSGHQSQPRRVSRAPRDSSVRRLRRQGDYL